MRKTLSEKHQDKLTGSPTTPLSPGLPGVPCKPQKKEGKTFQKSGGL